ncbi:TPA: helix-turn-helix transcriptional regulator [Escherichia coli]|jgi:Predicted transcriptional regulators|uniref:helix-turn-helix domain-containing protein n=1 Tax=Enterobacteriaceae TaxID=543 RepID=UPI0011F29755|nr:helix-turn-helix transcriptional regulator [Enterobacter cloacae]EBX4272725.1 XRE family transcriptional regulator [Salmonella enterica subsp. enterica serovar Pomona]EJR7283441.1 helix-turn-helix transcriptional regulator [Citrobacter freundii]ELC3909442.1 helix-turn-helix transcriptional regulator [Escherichia coli]KAA1141750.1 helix-turn-helix transcriptional regulator [Citrobacter portucalensis]MCW1829583.1 helix-turn-helix domain-containing protein [Enterobacter asburiae]
MANSSSLGEKIRLIREAEGLTRAQLAEMLDVPYGTLNNYEMKGIQMTEKFMVNFTNHPRFEKYALWLMTDKTAPSAGQVSPALSPDGQGRTMSRRSGLKTG